MSFEKGNPMSFDNHVYSIIAIRAIKGNEPAISGILCLLPSRVYYFSSYLQRKVVLSSRPQ